jgi:hypothetical protein
MDNGGNIRIEPDTSEEAPEAAWTRLFADWLEEQSELVMRELERESERD